MWLKSPSCGTSIIAAALLIVWPMRPCHGRQSPSPTDYQVFATANNFYGPGIVYGVDLEGNSYVLADIAKEAEVQIVHQTVYLPTSSQEISGNIAGVELGLPKRQHVIDKLMGGGFRSDFLDYITAAVTQELEVEQKGKLHKIEVQFSDAQIDRLPVVEVRRGIEGTDFWKMRYTRTKKLRIYLVTETISVGAFKVRFPNVDSTVLRGALERLKAEGLSLQLEGDSILAVSRLAVAYHTIPFDQLFGPLIGSTRNNRDYQISAANTSGSYLASYVIPPFDSPTKKHSETIPVSRGVPLAFTHFADLSDNFPLAHGATYGDMYKKLHDTIMGPGGAGFKEIKVYDCGVGFAIATSFEVTENSGEPLAFSDRFQPPDSPKLTGKRLRAFYFTVCLHPGPTAIVTTSKPQDLFSMDYGFPYLPDDMNTVPIPPGTSVRAFVVEFKLTRTNELGLLRNAECVLSGEKHLLQAGILKTKLGP